MSTLDVQITDLSPTVLGSSGTAYGSLLGVQAGYSSLSSLSTRKVALATVVPAENPVRPFLAWLESLSRGKSLGLASDPLLIQDLLRRRLGCSV